MALSRDDALVVRLSDYSETSQVVTLLARQHGLLRLMAKGVRRSTRARVAVGLDVLEHGEVEFTLPKDATGLGTLTQWTQMDGWTGLRSELDALYVGMYAAELTASLTEEQDPHPGLFEALLALLGALTLPQGAAAGESRGDAVCAVIRFQAALLRAIGYAPNLRACGVCGRSAQAATGRAHFSSAIGGFVCGSCASRCAEKRPLARELLGPSSAQAPALTWFDVLDYHLAHVASRPMRSGEALRVRWGLAPLD